MFFLPENKPKLIKGIAFAVSLITFGISLFILNEFQPGNFHFQLMEHYYWIPSLGISYQMGIDGISLWMVILTTFLGVVSVALSKYETRRLRIFFALLLLLETSLIGTFLALDLVLFYSFFELLLFPMAFLIWIWGDENRKLAATRFFIYLFGGSILMLVGMVILAHQTKLATGHISFSILDIQAAAANGTLWKGAFPLEQFVFWTLAIAFLIKSPSFPFHTWLVDSYTQAPIGAVLLGALIKTGVYGLIRFCLPLFPEVQAQATPIILTLAVIGILYGAILAAVQTDVKKVIAFSSVSHVGFIILGVFSASQIGLMGGVLGGFFHGVASGLLITLIALICMRRGSRNITAFGGLKAQMPIFATLFLVALIAAIGLPGTNGFISEFLSLLGAFQSGYAQIGGVSVVFAIIATTGVIFAVIYMLLLMQKMFYGPDDNPKIQALRDLHPWEIAIGVAFSILIFVGGVIPSVFTRTMEASVIATNLMAQSGVGDRPAWKYFGESADPPVEPDASNANAALISSKHTSKKIFGREVVTLNR